MFAVADLKKKWTNIKDSFVKDVKGRRTRKSRGPPEHRKKYYLFDHLQFLMPFINDAKSVAQEDGGRGRTETPKKRPRTKSTNSPVSVEVTAAAVPSSTRTLHRGMVTGTVTAGAVTGGPETPPEVRRQADALGDIAGYGSAAGALCHLDGDLSFMVSLLPTIKSMNEKQKINFKIGVLQLMARIKFDEVLQRPAGGAPEVAANQPFSASMTATDQIGCFLPGPYQPFPFINQAAVSSTQQQYSHVSPGAAQTSTSCSCIKKEVLGDDDSNSLLDSASLDTDSEEDALNDC